MKKIILSLICISLLTGCQKNSDNKQTSDYKRIVCTSIASCEVLTKLKVDPNKVVGVADSKSYLLPKEYEEKTKIGIAMSPDVEKIKKLKADLIISPQSLENELAKKYQNLNIDSLFLDLNSTEGLINSSTELASFLNIENQGNKINNEFHTFLKNYQDSIKNQPKPKVLILMGLPGNSYTIATENSYVGSLVKLAGSENLYPHNNGDGFINISKEELLKNQPDIILRTAHAFPEEVMNYFEIEFQDPYYQNFNAVRNHRVFNLDYRHFGMSANFDYQTPLNELKEILYDKET